MKRTLLLVSWLLVAFNAFSQQMPPAIEWQKSLGGSGDDRARGIIKTPDGGFLVVGYSKSNDGNVTGHHGPLTESDAWVVKLSALGGIEWQRSLGGTARDEFYIALVAPDGTYICAGETASNDGDVSGYQGLGDIWVVNLDRQGNIIWQKTFGGNSREEFGNLRYVHGHYMIVGQTFSTTGQVSGNHGNGDVWLAKVNVAGTFISQATMGGSNRDEGFDVTEFVNGGYILAVDVDSDDGTFGLGSGNPPRSGTVRLDSNYNFIAKAMGQRQRMITLARDGQNFYSGVDVIDCYPGNPTASIKTSAATLSNCIGSLSYPSYTIRIQGHTSLAASKGDLVVVGTSNDSTGYLGPHHSLYDGLISGQRVGNGVLWKKLIGGSKYDYLESVALIDESQLIVAGYSNSNDGDVSGNHGDYDFWIVKLGKVNAIRGTVFMDYNLNSIKDGNEPFVNNVLVESVKGATKAGSLTFNGNFRNTVDTGSYVTRATTPYPYYTPVPSSRSSSFTSYNNSDSFSFALQPIPGKRDYKAGLNIMDSPRPGFEFNQQITYTNVGTDTLINRLVKLIKDSRTTFLSANPAPLSVSNDTITWNISTLDPRQSGQIDVKLKVATPPTVVIHDTLFSIVSIDTTGDLAPANNTAKQRTLVRGSYDPNDKNESLGGTLLTTEVANQYLTYTVRFQNTGNDTAFTVVIKDTLDAKLDLSSIEMVGASHNYTLDIRDGNKLTWTFNKILLVDSIHNEPASHGYIIYRIKALPSLVAGDIISNRAAIYFDFNPAVITNTHQTIVKLPLIVQLPSVSGIASDYCSTLGVQKGKLNNVPAAGSGITVTVKLDGNALAVAADSTFSFNVSTLAGGAHTIVVTYASGTDTKTTTVNFNVTAAVIPDVNVSSNITTAINTIDPIIITAANAAGGGTSPLYTFGKDRNFGTLWQAESANNVLNITPTTLQTGDNWIYVRMKTSSSCYTAQFNIDSIKIVYQLPAPNQPVINGLQASYCKTQGVQKAKLSNYPAAGTGMTVTVKLDGNVLSLVAADTSFSFDVNAISTGNHAIEVTYANSSGTKTTTANFTVSDAVTPVVNVSVNKATVYHPTDEVLVTATNAGGGGNAPVYMFARNRTFTDILQAEGIANTYFFSASSLQWGDNKIYVRMKTSSTCYLQQTDIDSITVIRANFIGLVDPDFPLQPIGLTPNPFRALLVMSGFNTGKSYTVSVFNDKGRLVRKARVAGQQLLRMNMPGLSSGTYMVQVYDETWKRFIGTAKVMKQ